MVSFLGLADAAAYCSLTLAAAILVRLLLKGGPGKYPVLTAWAAYVVADQLAGEMVIRLAGYSSPPHYYSYHASGFAQQAITVLVLAELFTHLGTLNTARVLKATGVVLLVTTPLVFELRHPNELFRPAFLILIGLAVHVVVIMLVLLFLVRRPGIHPGRTILGVMSGLFVVAAAQAMAYASLLVENLNVYVFVAFAPGVSAIGMMVILYSVWHPEPVRFEPPPSRPLDPELQHALRTIMRGSPDA